MIDTFNRTGPLMEAASYPAWAQQLIQDCSESKRRVVEHELYLRMRDNKLSAKTMRQYLIGGWPVVEQFALYMIAPALFEWWLRPVRSATRVGEQSAVVWKRLYLSPWLARRSSVGMATRPGLVTIGE